MWLGTVIPAHLQTLLVPSKTTLGGFLDKIHLRSHFPTIDEKCIPSVSPNNRHNKLGLLPWLLTILNLDMIGMGELIGPI